MRWRAAPPQFRIPPAAARPLRHHPGMSAAEGAERTELTARQLREELMAALKRSGSLDAVKVRLLFLSDLPALTEAGPQAQLRSKLVEQLRARGAGAPGAVMTRPDPEAQLARRGPALLVADFLRRARMQMALSVFLPEAGISYEVSPGLQMLRVGPAEAQPFPGVLLPASRPHPPIWDRAGGR